MLLARVVVGTGAHSLGEAARRRVGEAAGVPGPAEAAVEVNLGPVVLAVDLAVGLEHHGATLNAVEVGDGELGAGIEKAPGSEGGADQDGSDDGDERRLHFRVEVGRCCLVLMVCHGVWYQWKKWKAEVVVEFASLGMLML